MLEYTGLLCTYFSRNRIFYFCSNCIGRIFGWDVLRLVRTNFCFPEGPSYPNFTAYTISISSSFIGYNSCIYQQIQDTDYSNESLGCYATTPPKWNPLLAWIWQSYETNSDNTSRETWLKRNNYYDKRYVILQHLSHTNQCIIPD